MMAAATQPAREQAQATAGRDLATRFLAVHEARAIVPAWRALFHAAAEANPFYGPDFLLPLLALGGRLARARLLVVTQGEELLALCPLLPRRFGLPGFTRAIATIGHDFVFNSLPLMRAGFELTAWQAVLEALLGEYRRGLLLIEPSPLDGPAARALMEALAASGRAHLLLDATQRIGVIAAGRADEHVARIKARTLSKLRRNERELAKRGRLAFRVAISGQELKDAVEAFLTLEAASWKGRQGSALASDPATAAFARQALAGGGDAPSVRAELLMSGDRPIGIFLNLVSPGYAATFKIAHDQELNRQAPGVLTMLHSLRRFLDEPWTRRLDSGAAPEHAVGAIWQDRFPAGALLVALSPQQRQGELAFQAKAEALALRLRAKARDLHHALTGRRRTEMRKPKD
jgi:CelD/BcsL family acetyltransferase involved in cellulose biosynthesis